MFKYYSPRLGKIREIDLDTQACLHARFVENISWRDIVNPGAHQTKLDRAAKFGEDCTVYNLNDVRSSSEWRVEIEKFAANGDHNLDKCMAVAVYSSNGVSPRKSANTSVASAKSGATSSDSGVSGVLRVLNARAQVIALCKQFLAEDEVLIQKQIAAAKMLQSDMAKEASEFRSVEELGDEVSTLYLKLKGVL